MPRLMEIRKQHGFPQPFGKASQKTLGFATFSTASTAGSHSTRFRPSLYADNSVLNFWEKSPVGRAHSNPEIHTLVWPNGADFDPATLHDWPAHKEAFRERVKQWEAVHR